MILIVTIPDGSGERDIEIARGLKLVAKADRKLAAFLQPWLEARLEVRVRPKNGQPYRKVYWRKLRRGLWTSTRRWARFPRQSDLPQFEESVELFTTWLQGLGASVSKLPGELKEPWPGHEPPVAEDHLPGDKLFRRYVHREGAFLGMERVRVGLKAAVALIYREGIFVGRMEKTADPAYRKVARALREAELDLENFRREHFEMTNALRAKEGLPPFTREAWERFVRDEAVARTHEMTHLNAVAESYPRRRREAAEQERQEGDGKPRGRPATHGSKKR